jgi:tRNA nucleotidyltransferase (CCA-adding enzyme)
VIDLNKIDPDTLDRIWWINLHVANAETRLFALGRERSGPKPKAYLVGGCVRDLMLGIKPKDIDLEIFGLDREELLLILKDVPLIEVGKSFGVFKVQGTNIDIALARTEIQYGDKHTEFHVHHDKELLPEDAAIRRDFTINAMMYDLDRRELFDPFNGARDLTDGILHPVSRATFREDALRVLRAMQFLARFKLRPSPALIAEARGLSMANISAERIYEEWKKLLLLGIEPSRGLQFLNDVNWLRFFPELKLLVNCHQDPQWHPEGDVWTHICHVMDEFAKERLNDEVEDLVVGMACLCHDLGKPARTEFLHGRWRSHGHSEAGVEPTKRFLDRMRAPGWLVDAVVPLVVEHQKPYDLYKINASDRVVRRLARRVGRIDRLARVSKADANGRPPLARQDPDPATFWLL